MYLLGYDIGSSRVKVALVNGDTGQVIDVVYSPEREMDIVARQSGWAEQHPDIWWKNVCLGTKKIIKRNNIDPHEIKSLGISYQMHGLVLVDENLQILRPSIIWCDSRAAPIGRQAFQDLGEEYCLSNLLNSPGNFTASKLKWVKDNEPEIYKMIHKVMLPGDYIAMKFTGEINTTIGGLSEAILWNFKKKELAYEVLDYFEIDHSLIPDVISVFSEGLKVKKSAARECGLKSGAQVTYRAGDQPNNALSLQVWHPGEVAATSGTSGVVYGIVDDLIHDEQSRINSFTHVNYDENFNRIGALLCINGAGIQYSWLKHQIARADQSYEDMERMVNSVPVGSEGVRVLPFGNGAERMFSNKNVESHIFNIEFNRHTRAHMYRASLEGVAFSFVHGINMLKEMGLQTEHIRVGNDNMFQSRTFAMTIATLLNCQIDVYDTTGAIGAARASGISIRHYNGLEDAFREEKPFKIYEPGLNYGMCFQAYNYWLSSLNTVMHASKDMSSKINMVQHHNKSLVKENKAKSQKIINLNLEIDRLKTELRSFKSKLEENNGLNTSSEFKKLIKHIDNLSQVEVAGSNMDSNLKYLNTPFVQKLSKQYPHLAFEDLKLAYLLIKKLSTKEIANIIGLSIRGVETRKYRLKKKLDLSRKLNLLPFLQDLVV